MERINKRLEPYNRTGQTPVAIGSGGTDSETAEQAREMLGIMDYASIDTPANPVKLDGDGKIPTDRISIGNGDRLILIGLDGKIPTEAASLIQGVVPTVKLPQVVINGQIAKLLITNFDINTVYDITSDTGAVMLVGNEIQYLSTGSATEGSVRVNGFGYSFSQANAFVGKPSITTPVVGAIVNSGTIIITSSGFSSTGSGNVHSYTDWEVSRNPAFTDIFFSSYSNAINRTSVTITGVPASANLYVRVRHAGSISGFSEWSETRIVATTSIEAIVPASISVGESGTIVIQNYDPNTEYSIKSYGCTWVRDKGNVTVTPIPGFTGNGWVEINGQRYTFEIKQPSITKPRITSPVTSSTGAPLSLTGIATEFSSQTSSSTLSSSEWEISLVQDFSSVYSVTTGTSNVVTLTNLSRQTTYFLRMRYRDNRNIYSEWSDSVSFTTRNTVSVTGEVQGLNYYDPSNPIGFFTLVGGQNLGVRSDGSDIYGNFECRDSWSELLFNRLIRYSDNVFGVTTPSVIVERTNRYSEINHIAVSDDAVIYLTITPVNPDVSSVGRVSDLNIIYKGVSRTPLRVAYDGSLENPSNGIAISRDSTLAITGSPIKLVNGSSTDTDYIIVRITDGVFGPTIVRKLNKGVWSGIGKVSISVDGKICLLPNSLGGLEIIEDKNGFITTYTQDGIIPDELTSNGRAVVTAISGDSSTVIVGIREYRNYFSGSKENYKPYILKKNNAGNWTVVGRIPHNNRFIVGDIAMSDDASVVYLTSYDMTSHKRQVSVYTNDGVGYKWSYDLPGVSVYDSPDYGYCLSCTSSGDLLVVSNKDEYFRSILVYK